MGLTTSLTCTYTFENSGAMGTDDSGNGKTLTVNGSVPQAAGNAPPGTHASSWSNNGANNMTRAAIYDGSTDFMIACWVYVTAFQVFDLHITGQWQSGATQYQLVLDHTNKDFKMQGSVNGSSATTSVEDGQGAISLNTWYFVQGYYNRATQKLGVNRNNGTAVEAALASVINIAQPLTVGANGVGGGFPMSGRIDAREFYSRLLTANESTTLYAGGAGLEYPFPTRRHGAGIFRM